MFKQYSTRPKLVALLTACALLNLGWFMTPARGFPSRGDRQMKDTGLVAGESKPLIIVLKGPSLSQYWRAQIASSGNSMKGAPPKLSVDSISSREFLGELSVAQERFAADLLRMIPGATIGYKYQVVLNGMAVMLPINEIEKLSEFDEIDYVAPVLESHYAEAAPPPSLAPSPLDTSVPLMGATDLWAANGGPQRAGLGMKIGIVDSGVDFSNPMFIDSTLEPPNRFPKGDLKLANGKVIVAKYFQSMTDSSTPTIHPGHRTAQDLDGHGTHSASCAAGNFINVGNVPGARPVMMSGVAPKAYIGSYRVFAPRAMTDNIVAAVEDAVRDGMDVINISFGSALPATQNTDPVVDAVNNASRAGVVVCVAIGNLGSGPLRNSVGGTIASPANASEALTVGASTNAHDGLPAGVLADIQITAPPPPTSLTALVSLRGSGGRPITSIAITGRLVDVDLLDNGQADGGGLACDRPGPNSLNGAIALIQDGGCLPLIKAFNALSAGAAGIIFYNSEDEGEQFVSPLLLGFPVAAVGLPRTAGLALKAFVDQNAVAGIPTMVAIRASERGLVFDTVPDRLAEFSSRGPTLDYLIKPDLLAPGAGSYAATQAQDPRGENRFPSPDPPVGQPALYDPTGFIFASGTSFSAPRAAGAVALLRQLHRDWSAAEVKSALMGATVRPNHQGELGLAGVMGRGAGGIDLRSLARLTATTSPASHSFGRVVAGAAGPLTKRFTIMNRSNQETTYRMGAQLTNHDPAVSIQVEPASLAVGPGQSGAFFLTLQLRSTVPAEETDSEGFVTISDNRQTIPDQLYLPFWVRTASR